MTSLLANPHCSAISLSLKDVSSSLRRTASIRNFSDSAPLSAKLPKNSTLKTYKGFPHGMPTTEADTINADLLTFLKA
jgi:hypothetical protein